MTRDTVTDQQITIQLNNSDDSEIRFPSSVNIPANEASVSFSVFALDDTLDDGLQSVTLTATPQNSQGTLLAASSETIVFTVEDNDGAGVNLSVDQQLIAETGSATGTITLSDAPSENITVNLSNSNPNAITIPPSVSILAGNTTATFAITGVDDGTPDGIEAATITATATGYTTGNLTLEVSDSPFPDLVFSQLALPDGYTDTLVTLSNGVTYTILNNGLASAVGTPENPWFDRFYLSNDPFLSNDDLRIGEPQNSELPFGET
ncbi:MAG: hypothetical protein MK111_21480, partial [Crocosphaera sp.]|uniref:hypothetical protein n=1 Tax=Crocosphaera sp. TaxID=2729996 RepID=UPI00258301C5